MAIRECAIAHTLQYVPRLATALGPDAVHSQSGHPTHRSSYDISHNTQALSQPLIHANNLTYCPCRQAAGAPPHGHCSTRYEAAAATTAAAAYTLAPTARPADGMLTSPLLSARRLDLDLGGDWSQHASVQGPGQHHAPTPARAAHMRRSIQQAAPVGPTAHTLFPHEWQL